jgi:hypothetical protein
VGNFSYKLYRLFLSLHSFSVTLLTLGFHLFFILLQINNKPQKGIVFFHFQITEGLEKEKARKKSKILR